jgi:hypothetical protein
MLDANPLDDIRNTTKISGVIVGDRYFPRAALDDMLAQIEKPVIVLIAIAHHAGRAHLERRGHP